VRVGGISPQRNDQIKEKVLMSLKCALGFHKWKDGRCTRCGAGRKTKHTCLDCHKTAVPVAPRDEKIPACGHSAIAAKLGLTSYRTSDDFLNEFRFSKTGGKLNISVTLWGYFTKVYAEFAERVANMGDDMQSINPDSRKQYASVLGRVDRYLDRDAFAKAFGSSEQGRIVAVSLLYTVRTTVKRALADQSLMATESTFCDHGFIGLLNDILRTGMTVDRAVNEFSQLSYEELAKRICDYLNEKAGIWARRR
jgi:hypothetical protein